MNVEGFLAKVRGKEWYKNQVVDDRTIPAREAIVREPEAPLHLDLVERLTELGRWPLYSHQAEAIDAAMVGENVVVATPTASGKSLCFQAPVLHEWLEDPSSRALFLYPTKALAQDQLKALRVLAGDRCPKVATYDRDTNNPARRAARQNARVLITNPDMLHVGILPHHDLWSSFFALLRTVVVDEAHTYRGVFGSHVAMVLRRLRRVCANYGVEPRFILCSATIGNPAELAENLTGQPFTAVTESGAPRGEKRFLFWNPPLQSEVKNNRHRWDSELANQDRSGRILPQVEAAGLLAEAVSEHIRTLAFVRSRPLAELVTAAAKSRLGNERKSLAQRIAPYRSTYLPEQRRSIENGLKEGQLLGVASTNALELGMDIGGLDAVILTGYPGSLASTWQQAGRSGRRGETSLAVLVADDDPLDQYLMQHPDFVHERLMEHARVATDNPIIFSKHLLCAAYEAPLGGGDHAFFGPSLAKHVVELEQTHDLRKSHDGWRLSTEIEYPAGNVNLRSTTEQSFVMVDCFSAEELETGLEDTYAFSRLHQGAVYLHQGNRYIVTELDLTSRQALVRKQPVNYFTVSRQTSSVRVLEDLQCRTVGPDAQLALSKVEVTRRVVGYYRIPFQRDRGGRNLKEELLELPPLTFTTIALRFGVPGKLAKRSWDLAGGLHAVEHAAIGVLPLFALCDREDIDGVSTPMHPDTGAPTVFIYDAYPGGIGIAERGFEIVEQLWQATLQAITECVCSDGCPACIQSPKCGYNNFPLDKGVAAHLLRGLLGKPENGLLARLRRMLG